MDSYTNNASLLAVAANSSTKYPTITTIMAAIVTTNSISIRAWIDYEWIS